MMPNLGDTDTLMIILVGGSAALFVICLGAGVLVLLMTTSASKRERMQQRLGLTQIVEEEKNQRVLRLWRDGVAVTTSVPGKMKVSIHERYNQMMTELGWHMPMTVLISIITGLVAVGFIVVWLLSGDFILAIAGAAGGFALPYLYIKREIKKRSDLFDSQLADALALATRSLRAGHPLEGALQMIVEELQPPISTIFGDITQQQALGVGLADAIRETAGRCSSNDMRLFAAALTIQIRSGGNLADMMDRMVGVIRDRFRIYRKVKILNAQTQLSKRVLLAMPFLILVILYVLDREYIIPLYTTEMGRIMMFVAGGMLLVGTYVINKVAVVKY